MDAVVVTVGTDEAAKTVAFKHAKAGKCSIDTDTDGDDA